MIPRILEYEDGRIKVTAEAFAIPEIKALIDKYDMNAEPYLSYVYSMSAPDSPYCNVGTEEKSETIIYDVKSTLGDFEHDDPLLKVAIDKLVSLYTSQMVALAQELGDELYRIRMYLKSKPISDGANGNLKDRLSLMERIDKVSSNYTKVKEQADKELKAQMKGNQEMGEY